MKFKKSKPQSEVQPEVADKKATFFGKSKSPVVLSPKEQKLLADEKQRKRTERAKNIKKGIGQFFTILFVIAVIFSMIVVPLLIVFG